MTLVALPLPGSVSAELLYRSACGGDAIKNKFTSCGVASANESPTAARSPARKTLRDGVNGSTTEDSSGYSADEATSTSISNHVPRRDNDLLVPTCSSSDVDRTSPEMDGPIGDLPVHFKTHSLSSEGSGSIYSSVSALRQRNGVFGGSMRIPTRRQPLVNTIDEDLLSLNSTRSTSALSRASRPPPPPYPTAQKPPKPPQSLSRVAPPPYPGCNDLSSRSETPSIPNDFSPQNTSTPKADRGYPRSMKIAAEGERRDYVREKDERNEKAMSLYENVENGCSNPISPNSTLNSGGGENGTAPHNGSTVWYEYGCV
uniref:SUZ domain-containing protein n=1 Tax=Steinernema glaseri TaxID=37863 RepID=A0A1I7YWE4_9BILA